MNVNELCEEFNLVYNNLGSNKAPGLDKYEISVYMTKSQNIIEDGLYREFEQSEEARKKLSNMLHTEILYPQQNVDNYKLFVEDTMFMLPEDLKYIVNEKVKMNSTTNICVRNKFIDVQPCLHDEIDRIKKNPYRFNSARSLRLDTSVDGVKYAEIVSLFSGVEFYKIRYIKKCKPIILVDLRTIGDGLSIDGKTEVSPASLDESLHRQIVETAAKLAYNDYKN